MADWLAGSLSAVRPVLWAELFPEVGGPLVLALLLGIVALGALWPMALVRLGLVLLAHSLFWLRVRGREHLPARGGVLLVCNPVSYLGWLLILAASRRRIRFVILAGWTRRWGIRQLLRWTGAFAAEPTSGQANLERLLGEAGDALGRGEAVCLFAEGCRTRDGFALAFHQAFEQVAARAAAPVVPVSVEQPWGSLLTVSHGRFVRKWPQEIPSPVEVAFGPALPPGARAADARQAVQMLSAQCAVAASARRRPVHRQFVRVAARRPFRPCFFDSSAPGRDLTYGRACAGMMLLARLLRPLLGDAPMVGIWLPPSTGGTMANLVLAVLGKASVNLNYTSSPEVIQSALRQCGCRHVLTSRKFTARLKLEPGPGVELIYLEDFAPRIAGWQKLLAFLAVLFLPGWVLERWVLGLGRHTLDDLATVIFSSGSTGDPKGVMLTHGNVAANAASIIQATGLGPRDRALAVLPFFHSFGYTVALWVPLQVGSSAVYHADPRQAKEIGELCRKYACSIYLSTATFLRFCLKKCEPDDFKTVRILMCGAEKLPPALAQDFQRRFSVMPLEGYGCTELSPAVAANMADQEFEGFWEIHNRPGTVGPPLPGNVVRVEHPETRAPLPVGDEGLLLAYGANVMKGYLGRPELTAEAVSDGWYVTGDMARVDADGYITLTGRLSRFAKIGGEMVPLEMIEEELHEILGTSDRVCAVTCVPCESRGERLVVLYLASQLSQFEVGEVRPWWQQLNGRGLPNLWVPGERDFFAVDELPLLGSGKVNLKGCKELALKVARK